MKAEDIMKLDKKFDDRVVEVLTNQSYTLMRQAQLIINAYRLHIDMVRKQ